ncbi:hypothetical protein WUBG_14714 [Wuchereria bancrofti]|uniref:FZ domain-containing protein n=1 Tax=Wuchereria bancrofti TaxID=6293 RepID=J9EBH4_WUCBA|nr:hypothetical protein WUBG_14714 [Wuchereria bancrofti]
MFHCFAPVCLATLDREILPCHSLCTAVQQGCEIRMRQYGFPWPEMLSCNKYPKDNDMCIGAVSEKATRLGSGLLVTGWAAKAGAILLKVPRVDELSGGILSSFSD